MKNLLAKTFFLLVLFCSIINYSVKAQTDESAKPEWFTSQKVADNVWCINDHGNDNIYLVIGTKKALLIDTGIGVGDLKSYANTLTNLPIVVVNTHAHPDHSGGNYRFNEIFIHPNDFKMADSYSDKDRMMGAAKSFSSSNPEFAKFIDFNFDNYKQPKLVPIEEGFVFDLGDRKIEVIWVPGHTLGSICLLDRKNKQLFTGDNNNTHVWLFLDVSAPVEKYMQSLEHLMTYRKDFNKMFIGHGEPMGSDYLDEIHTCVDNILKGECNPQPYENGMKAGFGEAVQCTYKRALVAFKPEYLHKK
jgi:glyoxylase-like metal-dependent hydrolase (beta-lactamase superfamily II)